MSDNPFSEPEDTDRTILHVPGAGAPPSRGPAPGPAPYVAPPPPAAAAPAAWATPMAGEAESMPRVGRNALTAAAAPLLDLLARIGIPGAAAADGNALRDRAERALQAFEAECRAAQVPSEQLRAAHYALCAALDDVALDTPWGQSSAWAARTLSATFHHDVRSGERFFDMLAGLQKEPGRFGPALEVCYLCMALGMRGRYRVDQRASGEFERLREGLHQLLAQLQGPWERALSPHWRGVDAPNTGPRRQIPPWAAAAATLALLAIGWVVGLGVAGARGDALQGRLVALPPGKTPAIERGAAVVPPAALAPAGAEAVDRFRRFLAPEIAARQVEVLGDAQRLVVRVASRGMFASGSSDIEPPFDGLMRRIGEALRNEPGSVTVLGHSDNQPIRTVRFPSNFELSAARAEAARGLLAAAAGQPQRFSAAGRADTEALVSNATPEGRETNRRIEVVLSLAGGR